LLLLPVRRCLLCVCLFLLLVVVFSLLSLFAQSFILAFCPLPCSALAVSLLFVVVAFCSSWSLEYIAVVVRVFYFFMFVYFAFVVVAIFAVVP